MADLRGPVGQGRARRVRRELRYFLVTFSRPGNVNRVTGAASALPISGGEGLVQFGELALAFVLSALIGTERAVRQKAAGLRTHSIVGVAAALIVLVSKYGFSDVLVRGYVNLDPARVAAQIVSGIGFLGAGLIFVRRDVVSGLTTAATIWMVAGIGMACGAGLPLLAMAVVALYFVAIYAFPALAGRLPSLARGPSTLRVSYEDGRGVLRRVIEACTGHGFQVSELETGERPRPGVVSVVLVVYGRGPAAPLAASLQELDGVLSVSSEDSDTDGTA
jgi:putative Mg2+ transporter-C (MgtC) family protein